VTIQMGRRAQKADNGSSLATELASYNVESFNEGFIKAFKTTSAFELWDCTTDSVIFDLVEPKLA
jgi:hypothetical protein